MMHLFMFCFISISTNDFYDLVSGNVSFFIISVISFACLVAVVIFIAFTLDCLCDLQVRATVITRLVSYHQ